MTAVYAVPYAPPPGPINHWGGLIVTWTDWEGTVWDLSDWRSGAFLLADGVEGLNMPATTDWVSSSPAVHGQRYRGGVTNPRSVFWPVHVWSEDSASQWERVDRAFWRGLQPGKFGTWSVTTPSGTKRSIRLRFVDDGQHQFSVDPFQRGWASYGVTLVADDPFWNGEPERRAWADQEGQNFYGGPALFGPPFFISSASQLSTATLTNKGDVDAWPTWTIRGPATSVQVGVGDRLVSWSGLLLEGDTLVIDTDPTVQTAWKNGVDVTSALGSVDFTPIPAGSDRPLSLALSGTGSVEAAIVPRHYRAW